MKPQQPNRKKAVALKYDPDERPAPVVAAKGEGSIAENIIAKAMQHGIPVQEDASLVEILSRLELDQEIPSELYQLVAEILSFVYRADQQAALSAGEGGGQGVGQR